METSKSSNLVWEKSGNIIIFIPQSVLACLTEYNYTYHRCYKVKKELNILFSKYIDINIYIVLEFRID